MKAHFSCVLAYTAAAHHIILMDGLCDSDSALGTEVKSTREMNERNSVCLRRCCSQGITDLSLEIKQRNSNASKC